jgi:hypothetical protein
MRLLALGAATAILKNAVIQSERCRPRFSSLETGPCAAVLRNTVFNLGTVCQDGR